MEEPTCGSELHDLYPHHCPDCNPEAYQKAVNQAPEGEEEDVLPGTEESASVHTPGYSDRY